LPAARSRHRKTHRRSFRLRDNRSSGKANSLRSASVVGKGVGGLCGKYQVIDFAYFPQFSSGEFLHIFALFLHGAVPFAAFLHKAAIWE
jgi:hypothetical protein